MISNPCIELWFLLHSQDCKSELDSRKCIKKYEALSPDYKKGRLNVSDLHILEQGEDRAIERAKKMVTPENPSTTVYKLVEALRAEIH